MTLPKDPVPYERSYVSERYAQLEEMIKIARKCFPQILHLLYYEQENEELKATRERNRRMASQILKGK